MNRFIVVPIAVFVLTFAGLFVLVEISKRRTLSALAAICCLKCGRPFGLPAAAAARESYLATCEEIRRQHPDRKVNFSPNWTVSCGNCQASAKFNSNTHMLASSGEGKE